MKKKQVVQEIVEEFNRTNPDLWKNRKAYYRAETVRKILWGVL